VEELLSTACLQIEGISITKCNGTAPEFVITWSISLCICEIVPSLKIKNTHGALEKLLYDAK